MCTYFVVKRLIFFNVVEIFENSGLSAGYMWIYVLWVNSYNANRKWWYKDLWCIIELSEHMISSGVTGINLKIQVVSKHYIFFWFVLSRNVAQYVQNVCQIYLVNKIERIQCSYLRVFAFKTNKRYEYISVCVCVWHWIVWKTKMIKWCVLAL